MSETRPVVAQLLTRMDVIETPSALASLLTNILETPTPRIISFLNAHAVNLASEDLCFLTALVASNYLLRDGIGIKIACWLTGRAPGLNLNGTDLIPSLAAAFSGRTIVLFGARQDSANLAAANLSRRGIDVALAVNGFESDDVYVAAMKRLRPALVILALGMPKQEQLALKLKAVCVANQIDCTLVNGGAIIDFLANRVRRAPRWMRRTGLEWMFRLAIEPRRLARRYLIGNPSFLMRVIGSAFATRTSADAHGKVGPSA